MSWGAKLGGGRIWRYELEPVDGGTLVRETWDISQEASLSKPLVSPRRQEDRREHGQDARPHRAARHRLSDVRRRGRDGRGRTTHDWLAVASRVPSSAQSSTRPWPKPRAMAWTRTSMSTHSVGTSVHTRKRVVEAAPGHELTQGLGDAERHVVAEDRERRRRHLEPGREPGPERAVAVVARAVERGEVAAACEAHLESLRERVVDPRDPLPQRAVVGRWDVGEARPLAVVAAVALTRARR